MKFYSVLYVLSILSVALATDEATVEWQIVKKMDGSLEPGVRVWFYELWLPQGDKTDCVSGYKHVRLISGARTGTKRKPGEDFRGSFNDMGADKVDGSYEDQDTDPDSGPWKGSHNRVYQWIGRTDKSEKTIKEEVEKYVREHPKYHMSGKDAVNCKTCVESVTHVPVERKAKRALEAVFDAAEVYARNDMPVRAEVFVA